jgi:hypothetical protein
LNFLIHLSRFNQAEVRIHLKSYYKIQFAHFKSNLNGVWLLPTKMNAITVINVWNK